VLVFAPFVILALPHPDVRGGWCQSGGRPRHYRIEDVAKGVLVLDAVAAAGFAVTATLTRRILLFFGAVLVGAVAFFFAYFVYAGSIDCAFY
jgi:hypothetical protein